MFWNLSPRSFHGSFLHVSSRCRGTDRIDSGCHLVIIYSAISLFFVLLLQEIFVDWGWCSGTSPLSPGLLLQINVCIILSLCLPPYSGCHFYIICDVYDILLCFGSWYLNIIYSTAGWHSGTSPLSLYHIAAVSAICFRLPNTIPDVQMYLFLSLCSLPFVVFNIYIYLSIICVKFYKTRGWCSGTSPLSPGLLIFAIIVFEIVPVTKITLKKNKNINKKTKKKF